MNQLADRPAVVTRPSEAIQAELASKAKTTVIAAGDVVTMKSGGETMCVVAVMQDGVCLSWFHDGQIRTGKLPLVCLKKGGDS